MYFKVKSKICVSHLNARVSGKTVVGNHEIDKIAVTVCDEPPNLLPLKLLL